MTSLGALVLAAGTLWLALRGVALLPEPAALNEPAWADFDLAWIRDREDNLWWAHARATVRAALRFACFAALIIGPGRRAIERLGALAWWKQHAAIVAGVAAAEVALRAAATWSVSVVRNLAEPTASVGPAEALETALSQGLGELPGAVVGGVFTLTLLTRWPRTGVVVLCTWSACSFAVSDIVALVAPIPSAAAAPPALTQVVERCGLAPDELVIAEGDDEPRTSNVWSGRRIVVSRGYLARTTPDAQATTVAHEAGHARAGDNETDFLIGVAWAVLLPALQGVIVWLFGRRLLTLSPAALWPLLVLVGSTAEAAFTVGSNIVNQRQELRADAVAVDAVGLAPFVASHIQLTRSMENDPALAWGQALWASHPDLVTRLAHARRRTQPPERPPEAPGSTRDARAP